MNMNSVGQSPGSDHMEQVRRSFSEMTLVPSPPRSRAKTESSSPRSISPGRNELSPRKFSLRSNSPVAQIKLPSRSSSRRGSFIESPIAPLLRQEEILVGTSELIRSALGNLRSISLRVPDNMSSTEFSTALLDEFRAFKEAVEEKRPLPMVQQKEVPPEDVQTLWNVAGQILVNDEFTQLFHELIEKLDEERKQGLFLSPRVRLSIAAVQYQEDANEVAEHLMSECTEQLKGVRVVNLNQLQKLLLDDRIKAFHSTIVGPIKDAAAKVMDVAIRDCQGTILFQTVKATKGAAQKAFQQWKQEAEKYPNTHFDIDGINYIARKCKLKVTVAENEKDSDQQQLAQLLGLKAKIEEVLQLFLEEKCSY